MKTMNPELQEPIMQKFIDENPSIQFAYVVDTNGKKTPGTSPTSPTGQNTKITASARTTPTAIGS